jgi:hypothetical protein
MGQVMVLLVVLQGTRTAHSKLGCIHHRAADRQQAFLLP